IASAGDALHDPVTRYLVGGALTTDQTHYEYVVPAYRDRWQLALSQFTGARVRLESASRGFAKVVVRVDGPQVGLAYALLDLEASEQNPLGPVYARVTERHATRAISYRAADGLEISGYLTVPSDKAARDLPLVVLVHGGPAARDTGDFDWWPQALASQGYAVLQANFRGSLLDTKFMLAGFGEWGRKMQTDLSDGVRHLADQGTIDPARVCIMGASYGGYAALAGVTLDAGVYRCAVSVAGVGDIEAMLEWQQANTEEREQRFWNKFMGIAGPGDPAIHAISPAEHATAVTVPVLLVHGKDDTVVPYEQSEAMLRALRRAGKEVELVTLRREDHWLSRRDSHADAPSVDRVLAPAQSARLASTRPALARSSTCKRTRRHVEVFSTHVVEFVASREGRGRTLRRVAQPFSRRPRCVNPLSRSVFSAPSRSSPARQSSLPRPTDGSSRNLSRCAIPTSISAKRPEWQACTRGFAMPRSKFATPMQRHERCSSRRVNVPA
ncbi:MAG TPA: prolyl oligopeptidase family serine peptidase, partial [Gammaproteobacteria bacterium]|nr:prolyl oligopeptidase family serine peptidase [Gammaproteobacteria bacterium]